MNCTYCFNNNIPNHYQTSNSLSTECKGLYFHYDLLLKKTIFKSSILSCLPNDPGSFLVGERGLGHQEDARLCVPHYVIISELTFLDIYVCYYITYLLPLTLFCIQFDMTYKWLCTIQEYFDNLEKNQSHTNVKHQVQ